MRFRKLRIAWSVVWGLLAVLLIALWVRSYWWHDALTLRYALSVNYQSTRGEQFLSFQLEPWKQYKDSKTKPDPRRIWDWTLQSRPVPTGDHKKLGLFWLWGREGLTLTAPHSFFVIAGVAGAALPWIGRAKRFSLRTLSIATTLLALVLGLVVYALRK
jgi:hypothetical protein